MIDRAALFLKLRSEAIRLISRQEQNREPNDSNHQSVASTHDRRHADAQTLPQDSKRISPRSQSVSGWLGRSPDTASAEDLRSYQLFLVDRGISPISLNAAITGLKFFFESTLDRAELMRFMQTVHVPHKIPVVLSRDEVARLIGAAGNLKNQTALSVAYGAGLRVSEVVALKVGDIDSQRMTLRIEQGKGSKDRYAMLSPVLLESPAYLVAHCPCRGPDAQWRLVVSRTGSGRSAQYTSVQPNHPRCSRGREDRQACLDAHAAPQLRHPPAGAEGRHPRDPGPARAQETGERLRCMPRWPPTFCAKWSVHWISCLPCERCSSRSSCVPHWRSRISSAPTDPRGDRLSTLT